MKCQCSLNNSYEIIGLCDISRFNQKINQFADKSWTQLIIPEKLVIPNDKASIKSITKVYLDIKITSTKVIKTPSSDSPNVEGLTLTGKLLLVSGQICQRIVYISNTTCNTVCSVKFNVNFSTYIVVDENTDLENDHFCIYPCVEDVSVHPLNERTISKSITLFLFAHKLTETPLPPVVGKLPNTFVFKTFDTNEEMARVEFDTNTKKLIVTSTDKIYNLPHVTDRKVFIFRLANGSVLTRNSNIKANENADMFRDELNDTPFDYNDIITLTFRDRPNVLLTNYPALGRDYSMLSKNIQSFKITPTGIVPNTLYNEIILNNKNNQPVMTLQFDISALGFIISSTGNTTDNGGPNYFKMVLLEHFHGLERFSVSIPGNTSANTFKSTLDDENFQFNNILKLEYEDSTKVVITDFPDSTTPTFNPSGTSSYFQIIQNRLIAVSPRISNIFVFKTLDTNEEMARVGFDTDNNRLVVTSTGRVYNDPRAVGIAAFTFVISTVTGGNLTRSIINGDENADRFKNELNNLPFNYDNMIRITYKNKSRVELINPPFASYSMISEDSQSFKILPFGIFPILLKNNIQLGNQGFQNVLIISFDASLLKLLVSSTGNVTDAGGANYFKMTLFASDGRTQKATSTIPGSSNANNFKTVFNDQPFEFNDVLRLEYEDNFRVFISNYPYFGSGSSPTGTSRFFRITQNGLV